MLNMLMVKLYTKSSNDLKISVQICSFFIEHTYILKVMDVLLKSYADGHPKYKTFSLSQYNKTFTPSK